MSVDESASERIGVYGAPSRELVAIPGGAVQFSPLVPGATALEEAEDGAFGRMIVAAPPGVLERNYVLAQSLRLLRPGGELIALAPKTRGGARLAGELRSLGLDPVDTARRHHRICRAGRPAGDLPLGAALADGSPRLLDSLGLWSQPGLFSWDSVDPGTAMLLALLPPLEGRGADFGCGIGLLARKILDTPTVRSLLLIDIDRRAIEAARRNVTDARASFLWRDLRTGLPPQARELDFVVMNPPFHDGGTEDRELGAIFIRRAAEALRPGGVCWLVANRHLPYEAALREYFETCRLQREEAGYKIYEALR